MADTTKKVSELETASQVDSTDLVMLSQGSSQSGFASLKTTILAIAQKIVSGINFTSDLQTESKTITGAINEVAQGGGGSSTFAGLSDVDIDDTTLANGQVPVWDDTEEKWKNGNGGGGTTVVANPTGTPTDELLAIQIGNDIYSLPEGESEHLLNDILTGPDATKATASSTSQDGAIWKAFDGVKTGTEQSCWIPEYGSTNCWVCYHFATPKYITKCHVYFYENMSGTYTGAVKIQGSNDGENWTDISQSQALSMTRGIHDYEIESTDTVNGYSYVRMFSETALVVYGSASACTLELEIYGKDNASGTTVIPNPEGEATDTLNKIQIGSDIYEVVGSGGGGSNPAYSINETPYCAWVDGTTVYQKTFTVDGDGTTREFTVQTGITNGKRLVNAHVSGLRWDSASRWWSPCYINIDNFSWSTHFSLNSDFSEFVVKANQFPLKNITVTLYYTKTDDIPYHGGGGGGHTILNDSGTSLAQEDDLQFKGTYSHDDSTNGKTVVEVTRSMTKAEYNQLTSEEKKGVVLITDENGGGINYSLTEQDTGITWVDGKKVYQKSYTGTIGSAGPTLIEADFSHTIIGVDAWFRDTAGLGMSCGDLNTSGWLAAVHVTSSGNVFNLVTYTGSALNGGTYFITVRYTKD